MQNTPVNESLIWEYIDGMLPAAEESRVATLVQENEAWRERYASLLSLHTELIVQPLDAPSMRFTKNVMEAIHQLQIAPATKNYLNKNLIRALGGFFILTIVGLVVYMIATATPEAPTATPTLDVITNYDFGSLLNNTTAKFLMMLQIVLGLAFLDRWLAGKRKGWL